MVSCPYKMLSSRYVVCVCMYSKLVCVCVCGVLKRWRDAATVIRTDSLGVTAAAAS